MLATTRARNQNHAWMLLVTVAACAGGEVRYRVIGLGDLPGGDFLSEPAGVNNSGVACGRSFVSVSSRAFVWVEAHGITALAGLPGCYESSEGEAINELGQIVGVVRWHDDCRQEAFLWSPDSGMIPLGFLSTSFLNSWAKGVNDLPQVVGYSTSHTNRPHAFLWDGTTGMIDVGTLPGGEDVSIAYGINDSTSVVGTSGSANGLEAFRWTPQDGMIGLVDLTGDPTFGASEAYKINNPGQICGFANTVLGPQGFLWDPQTGVHWLGFPYPGTLWSSALDLNERGQVVGMSRCCGPLARGFYAWVWDETHGMRALVDLLDPCTPAEFREMPTAVAINNSGQILVNAIEAQQAALLTPYLPGDLNGDGRVDVNDLVHMLSNFGRAGNAAYADGDVEGCDGDVDLRDLATLLSNFGEVLP